MAKKQTRRTFSVRAETYVRFARLCKREGWSMSGVVESAIVGLCDRMEEPPVTRDDALRCIDEQKSARSPVVEETTEEITAACFTF